MTGWNMRASQEDAVETPHAPVLVPIDFKNMTKEDELLIVKSRLSEMVPFRQLLISWG
jgi:hypothetical protein